MCIQIPSGCTEQNTYCPGESPPGACYSHNYATVANLAACGVLQSSVYYSGCSVLDTGCTIYSNSGCTSAIAATFFQANSGGNDYNFETNSSGVIINKSLVIC